MLSLSAKFGKQVPCHWTLLIIGAVAVIDITWNLALRAHRLGVRFVI